MSLYQSCRNTVYIRRVLRMCAKKQKEELDEINTALFVINISSGIILGNVIGNTLSGRH